MKIKISTVIKLLLTDLDRLDPVTVIAENFEPGQGKITIECYGKPWSAYWGSMGTSTIHEFICSADNGYLIGKLSPNLSSSIYDEGQALIDAANAQVQTLRVYGNWNDALTAEMNHRIINELSNGLEGNEGLLYELFGSEWWHWIPEKTNPDYDYLWRIVDAVKVGLTECNKIKKEDPQKYDSIIPCPDCGQNTDQDSNSYWCDDCQKLWGKE